jgi:lycopene cyclase CruA
LPAVGGGFVVEVIKKGQTHTLDLTEFRRQFPATVANFGSLPNREMWLRRIWELDNHWQNSFANGFSVSSEEIYVSGQPPANLPIEGKFEIIYAGGTLGLLHAAVMANRYGRKVLVFDAYQVGKTHRDWNISDEELTAFEQSGLFTKGEIEKAVVNRYQAGFVKFFDGNSKIKTPPLYMKNVLDVALQADVLLQLAVKKIKKSNSKSELLDFHKFIRAYVQTDRILIETEEIKSGKRKLFAAGLFIDATGTNSPLSRQINNGRSITHVCPTVGTVARGFTHGAEANQVDFSTGEILVSTEDCSAHRQLIWEGFAGNPKKDEYTTYLFFYDSVESKADKSLLNLFEEYFEKLPDYKRAGSNWQVVKPVFGYIPSIHHRGWHNIKKTAADRVLLIGDAAGLSSPLTFCGFGSHVRNLKRLTHLTELAVKAGLLDEKSLAEINTYEPRVAQMASLAEFMRPTEKSKSAVVNETMNAVMLALSKLDEKIRQDLFKDRMPFASFKSLLKKTALLHPLVFKRMFEHLGVKGSYWWLANIWEARRQERNSPKKTIKTEVNVENATQEFSRMLEIYKSQS